MEFAIILIVAYSYDDIGSKYNTDWYNEKYNISFTSSNKLFPYGQPHCFNTYVDGNKVDFKMDNNSGSISIGKESVFADKETVKNIVILIIMHPVNMIITMVY